MPRQRTLPRHEGKLLLHSSPTLAELELPDDMTDAQAEAIYKIIEEWKASVVGAFAVSIGRQLYIYDVDDEWYWCVEDTLDNSAQYRWLKKSAIRYAKRLVEQVNKRINYGIESA